MDYEWDPQKAAANLKNHKVDFADAVGVFEDLLPLIVPDDSHEDSSIRHRGNRLFGSSPGCSLHVEGRESPDHFGARGTARRTPSV